MQNGHFFLQSIICKLFRFDREDFFESAFWEQEEQQQHFFRDMLYRFCIDVMNIKLYRCLTAGPMGTTADPSKKKKRNKSTPSITLLL